MNELKIQFIQFSPIWGNVKMNLDNLERIFSRISNDTDLVVLPEMFSTGFVVQPSDSLVRENACVLDWMMGLSSRYNFAITGSMMSLKEEKLWNEMVMVHCDDVFPSYFKRHLFSYGRESTKYSSGQDRIVWNFKGWKIFPCICYDLRFPVWLRNNLEYDLLLCVANWPVQRIEHWTALLKARAIENLSYVLGVNRVGVEPSGLEYNGNSCFFDCEGKQLWLSGEEEISPLISLTMDNLIQYREHFGFLSDRDDFELIYSI